MKVLLNWLWLEGCEAFLLEGPEAELAIKCHKQFINCNNSEHLDALDNLLAGKTCLDMSKPIALPEGVDFFVISGWI